MSRKHAGLVAMVVQPAFVGCAALLVVLSWLPSNEMVRTGVGGRAEHAVAYFGTAIIVALVYREGPRLLVQFLLLVALAGILEFGQRFVPGRTSALLDFAASSTGAAAGGLLMWTARPRILSYLGLVREPDAYRT